jgi:hypothetical protein
MLNLSHRSLQSIRNQLGAFSVMLQQVISHARGGFHTHARQPVKRLNQTL